MDLQTMETMWRIAIISGTVFFCWLVGCLVYLDLRKKKWMFDERRIAIENGMTPPPLPRKQLEGWPGVKQREAELRAEERRLRIEKGLPVRDEESEPKTQRYYLRRGLLATCFGIGLALTYVGLAVSRTSVDGTADAQAWAIGLAPLFLLFGVANLIYQRYAPEVSEPRADSGRAD
jgi:hypothetical protein